MRKIRLFQKDAYIGIDFLNKKTEIIRQKEEKDVNVFAFDIETPKGKKTLAIANPTIPEVNAIKKELEEFSSAIMNNTKIGRASCRERSRTRKAERNEKKQ